MTAHGDNGGGELSAQELRAVEALASGLGPEAAAAAASVSERTLRRWRAQRRAFRDAVADSRRTAFSDALAGVRGLVADAVGCLRDLLRDDQAPAQARVQAARVVLDQATKGFELEQRLATPESSFTQILREGF